MSTLLYQNIFCHFINENQGNFKLNSEIICSIKEKITVVKKIYKKSSIKNLGENFYPSFYVDSTS